MLVNLTPHDVTILSDNNIVENKTTHHYDVTGEVTVLQTIKSEGCARVNTTETIKEDIDGIATVATEYGEIVGLPDPQNNIYYIVSAAVLIAGKAKGRTDLVVPAHVVRDGPTVLGCLALGR